MHTHCVHATLLVSFKVAQAYHLPTCTSGFIFVAFDPQNTHPQKYDHDDILGNTINNYGWEISVSTGNGFASSP